MKDFDLAFQVASQVVDLVHEVDRLRAENEELREYRRKYIEELGNSIQHNGRMLAGLLEIAMTPGVLPAMAKANDASPTVEDSTCKKQ